MQGLFPFELVTIDRHSFSIYLLDYEDTLTLGCE